MKKILSRSVPFLTRLEHQSTFRVLYKALGFLRAKFPEGSKNRRNRIAIPIHPHQRSCGNYTSRASNAAVALQFSLSKVTRNGKGKVGRTIKRRKTFGRVTRGERLFASLLPKETASRV